MPWTLTEQNPMDLRIPHGVTDLFLEQAAAKTVLEAALQETFRRWGYTRIIPPTFEYGETLATQASPQTQEEMYRFFDRGGHILALRPDMTVGTARIVSTKLYDQLLPLRLHYLGNVFRYVEPQAGRHREFTQAGIELIGAGTAEADAEVLAVAIEALRAMGLNEFQINVGQVAYLQALVGEARFTNGELRHLEQAIDRRNDIELQAVLQELGIPEAATQAIRALPHLSGEEGVLAEARALAPNRAARDAVERLDRVYQLLGAQGVASHIILDMGEIRSMAYYTGLTFRGYAAGLGFPICSGGRYDGLLAQWGTDLPAIGFALGVERVMLLAQPGVDLAPDLVLAACDHPFCNELAARARAAGLRVEVDVLGRQGEDLVAYARARQARRALHCEVAGQYQLWEQGEARSLSVDALEQEVAQWTC